MIGRVNVLAFEVDDFGAAQPMQHVACFFGPKIQKLRDWRDRQCHIVAFGQKEIRDARRVSFMKRLELVLQMRLPPRVRPRPWVDDDSAAQRPPGGFVADDEVVAPERHQRLRQSDLAERGVFGFGERRGSQQDHLGHSLRRSQMDPHTLMVLDPSRRRSG